MGSHEGEWGSSPPLSAAHPLHHMAVFRIRVEFAAVECGMVRHHHLLLLADGAGVGAACHEGSWGCMRVSGAHLHSLSAPRTPCTTWPCSEFASNSQPEPVHVRITIFLLEIGSGEGAACPGRSRACTWVFEGFSSHVESCTPHAPHGCIRNSRQICCPFGTGPCETISRTPPSRIEIGAACHGR